MQAAEFFTDNLYKGTGISTGLARGLQVRAGGVDLTQEGMGLGTAAIRSGGKTFFARESEVVWQNPRQLVIDYVIDTEFRSGTGGRADHLITRLRESLSAFYRLAPPLQKILLGAGFYWRDLLGIKEQLVPVEPLARARFKFCLHPTQVDIGCEFAFLGPLPQQLFIMNELGADFFTSAWHKGQLCKCPGGWDVCPDPGGLPFLFSPQFGLRYSLGDIAVDQGLGFKVCWGRERNARLCWAGFAIQINPASTHQGNIVCRYTVKFSHHGIEEHSDD
ncbi:MAG: hypothetical protein ABRQ23_05420 [Syntrophomonadaceae bacterium]